MVSDHKEDGGSVPVSVTADPGVIAFTGQADVTIIEGGSSAASLVKLSTKWKIRFSKLKWSRSWFTVTKRKSGAVF